MSMLFGTPCEAHSCPLPPIKFRTIYLQHGDCLMAAVCRDNSEAAFFKRVLNEFLLCDQEVLIRHLHKTTGDYVKEYQGNGATV